MAWTDETIRTNRLLLRAFTDADRPTVLTLLTDPDVREFLGGSVKLADDFDSHPLGRQWGVWGVDLVDSDASIGSCSVTADRGQLELHYNFVPSSWGHGCAHEACAAVLDWVWATTNVPEIVAVAQTASSRSLDLLSRRGFEETERFEEFDAEQSFRTLTRTTRD